MTVSDHWWNDSRPALESLLLPRATRALWEEDRRLAEAFAASPVQNAEANRGLAYWVFETTLVYSIFKDWLRYADAVWECSYPGQPSKKADLVVRVEGKPRLVCEAKWWGSSAEKVTDAREADVVKLLSWPDPVQRVLLTFWHSAASRDQADLKEVTAFAAGVRTGVVEPLYLGRFETDFAETRGTEVQHFSVAALAVRR